MVPVGFLRNSKELKSPLVKKQTYLMKSYVAAKSFKMALLTMENFTQPYFHGKTNLYLRQIEKEHFISQKYGLKSYQKILKNWTTG